MIKHTLVISQNTYRIWKPALHFLTYSCFIVQNATVFTSPHFMLWFCILNDFVRQAKWCNTHPTTSVEAVGLQIWKGQWLPLECQLPDGRDLVLFPAVFPELTKSTGHTAAAQPVLGTELRLHIRQHIETYTTQCRTEAELSAPFCWRDTKVWSS